MTPRGSLPISVVLPVRDGKRTLGAALESLRAQTFEDFEVVIVDDHSRDGTAGIARAWERRDGRFRVVRMGADGSGIVAALQRGLAEARGTCVARMDADDICHPERLAFQHDLLARSPGLAGCGTGVRLVPESTVTPRAAEYAAWVNSMTDRDTVAANIFVECPLAHPTFMFRARVLADVGGYRDRAWLEDYDLLLRLWRRGHRFVAVPRVLLDWRDDPGRLSRNHPAYSLAAFRACRVHHLRKSMLRGRSGVVVWGAGPTGKSLAREFARQGVNVQAFVEVDPRKIGQQIHGAPVLGVEAVRGVVGALHVGAVARSAGRAAVRGAVGGVGLGEGDFVAMA
ncbi:MAG: glycosyltransferase [Gemmatimonadota bacterium]|nr:glycosyltransferase [Gemmatimonadota bacterium]